MPKTAALHPKAYLTSKRNVKAGLVARSKILTILEGGTRKAGDVAKEAALSYECVTYHLKSMRKDRLVERLSKSKPFSWKLTQFGQQKLPTE
jgi:predicted transcriptional regulator